MSRSKAPVGRAHLSFPCFPTAVAASPCCHPVYYVIMDLHSSLSGNESSSRACVRPDTESRLDACRLCGGKDSWTRVCSWWFWAVKERGGRPRWEIQVCSWEKHCKVLHNGSGADVPIYQAENEHAQERGRGTGRERERETEAERGKGRKKEVIFSSPLRFFSFTFCQRVVSTSSVEPTLFLTLYPVLLPGHRFFLPPARILLLSQPGVAAVVIQSSSSCRRGASFWERVGVLGKGKGGGTGEKGKSKA